VAEGSWAGVRAEPQVVAVTRKGHSLVMRRMVRGSVPLLVRVRVWVLDWPLATRPKSSGFPGPLEVGMMLPVIARVPVATP